jgi:hypothetical protein
MRKAEPVSFTPRTLIRVRMNRMARQSASVWGWSPGKAETSAPTPAEMPTAELRM